MNRISIAALCLATLAAPKAGAQPAGPFQPIDPVPVCDRRFVDPVSGSDSFTGSLQNPWRTVNFALANVAAPGTIVLLPGVYSIGTNGEIFPIDVFRSDVSIQGTSALNTVLDAGGADGIRFIPIMAGQTFETTLVDGVTVTNADAAIRFTTEPAPVGPTIANCVLVKNFVGVAMTAIFCHSIPPDGYIRFNPRLVNDTIADNQIGILDEGVWVPSDPDPDGIVHGEAEPAIVNCLVYENALADLEGPDGSDLSRTVFCTAFTAGLAALKPGKPAPVSLLPFCGVNTDAIFVNRATWDYRLRPGTRLVGRGTQVLSVPNGTAGARLFQCGEDIFDVDLEGYGNPRIEGNEIDIGADEFGQLIVAGYVPMTTSFDPAFANALVFMTPRPQLAPPLVGDFFLASGGIRNAPFLPSSTPGARPQGTIAATPTAIGTSFVNQALLLPGFPQTIAMPNAGTPLVLPQSTLLSIVRRNLQVLPGNAGGAQTTLSNLQSWLVRP